MVPPPKFKDAKHFSKTKGKGGWYCNVCTAPERAELESMTRADAVRHERTRAHTRLVEKQAQELEQEQDDWQPPMNRSSWDVPIEWYTSWDASARADRMPDFIPFWRDGVMAAERGEEVGRMEEFLEKLERDIRQRNGLEDQWGRDIGLDLWGTNTAPDAWGAKKQDELIWETEQWDGPQTGWGVPDAGQGWSHGDEWHTGSGGWGIIADLNPWEIADEPGREVRVADWGLRTTTESSRKGGSGAFEGAHGDVLDKKLAMFVENIARQEDASPARRERLRKFSQLSTEEKIRQIQEAARILRIQT